jgi:glutamate 5-kinase
MDKQDKKRILLKVGSSTLTKGTLHISRGKIEDLARQFHTLKEEYDIILVSSGAIAAAKQIINLHNNVSLTNKQALASIGQPHLMAIYDQIFSEFGLPTAQCLLTYRDFHNEESIANIQSTIDSLLEFGYIPIINENDVTATEEIKFGDNDKLAALTATLLNVDLFIMATNTYGFYDSDPSVNPQAETIPVINDLSSIQSAIGDIKSDLGSGGMRSKIEAAEIAQKNKIETWLVYGHADNFLLDAMSSKVRFTKITPKF